MDPATQPQDQQPVVAQQVIQAAAVVQPQQPIVGTPAKAKELGPISTEITAPLEMVGSDAIEKEPIPPEVASWMEKVNRGETGEKLQEVVIADKNTTTPTTSSSVQPVYVLPLGEVALREGLHKSVSDSVRWLAEWCKRLIKKMGPTIAPYQAK